LWLIEGFTTLLEYPLSNVLYPESRYKEFFNVQTLQSVFREDESNTAPAMSQDVETIDEIESNFASIAYDKAGAVLRMFQHAVTETVFQEALRYYVKVNHHKVVTPAEFHTAVETVLAQHSFTAFNFTEAFTSWELQKGYPVIHVSYDLSQRQFEVTQKRYFVDPTMRDEANSKWTIPLNFATSRNANFTDTSITTYFDKSEDLKIIPQEEQPGWFVFNKQQIGFFRVNYDLDNWNNLIAILNSDNYQNIHVLNRAQIIDDVMSFAQSGLIDVDLAVGVLSYLRRETDYIPWAAASYRLSQYSDLYGGRNEKLNVS